MGFFSRKPFHRSAFYSRSQIKARLPKARIEPIDEHLEQSPAEQSLLQVTRVCRATLG